MWGGITSFQANANYETLLIDFETCHQSIYVFEIHLDLKSGVKYLGIQLFWGNE